MKRVILIIIILHTLIGAAYGQQPRFIFDRDSTANEVSEPRTEMSRPTTPQRAENDSILGDSMKHVPPAIPSWRIDSRLGERIAVPQDTLFKNYHQQSLIDGKGVAVGYLGNWGSPAQSKVFFEQEETAQFRFLDPYRYYYVKPEDKVFLDTKVPYSNISYYSGGGRKNKEERFAAEMAISFNKKFSLGFDIDYVYARGFYNSLSNKQNNYDLFASYKTDQYQMHAFVGNNNYTNLENGGLDVSEGITSDFLDGDSKIMPTNMSNTWNKLRGRRIYMTHKYSVGYNAKDSATFVPVASLIFTSNYTDQRRSFTSNEVTLLDMMYNYVQKELILPNTSSDGSSSVLNDKMSYYSFKNTLGISLNEGFRDWVKFGLTGFIEYDIHKYQLPGFAVPALSFNEHKHNSLLIGGLLSKRKGEFLRYNLYADLGITGYNSGESRLKADIITQFKLWGKDAIVSANGYLKTLKPTFYETNFISRYYNWTNDKGLYEKHKDEGMFYKNFGNITRTYVGGEIYIPHTQTRLSGGVENIKNYIYYDLVSDDTKPRPYVDILQESANIQVLAFRLDQKLNVGVLHFDNQVVYQTSSNEHVLPLPTLSLYSNLYLQFKVAKVLDVQMGVDAHFHTAYYAQGYDPVLLQFYNQHERKVGDFPFSSAYANFHLKKTRFFVMMYNVGTGIVKDNYFTLDKYPVNPMGFKFGLSWNFTN